MPSLPRLGAASLSVGAQPSIRLNTTTRHAGEGSCSEGGEIAAVADRARPAPAHYHGAVRACDVSMLLDSSDGSAAEKDAMPNEPRGMGVVSDQDKLEKACLGWWRFGEDGDVGRKRRLPLLYGNITVMIKVFAAKGLDVKDLVMLSMALRLGRTFARPLPT
ncbi:hypothetical protein ZWY2020_008423 [Hordeum vulgare]|nr:hypothetical protein ZWY2020_008423 [Hordeum vulgare]